LASSSDLVVPRKLKGFRDYNPLLARTRKRIIDTLMATAYRAGFEPINTPAIEYSETLLGTSNQETDKEMYKFTDHGGRDVALRFDLTVPFARFVAENQGTLVLPFKKIQVGDVWRGEKPQKGRYREFCQGDLDIVGADSLASDVEVISCLASVLDQVLGSGYTVSLGNRKILSALIHAKLGALTPAGETGALIALDKLAKIGPEAVLELLQQIEGARPEGASELLHILDSRDETGNSDLELIRGHLPANDETRAIMDRFQQTGSILSQLFAGSKGTIRIDLSIARGLGYYTGVVFETTINDLKGFGAICSGGRYDRLVSRFSRQEIPGVGGSIGVDRLLAALEELGEMTEEKPRGIFVAIATDDARAYGFQLVNTLRRAGFHADIALKEGKLANQFKYADKKGYPFVVTVGKDEMESQVFSLKNMSTGDEQKNIPLQNLPSLARDILA
jgi:histidyl-tRNA synthetase